MQSAPQPLGEERAWALLRGLAGRARSGRPVEGECGVGLDDQGGLEVGTESGWIHLDSKNQSGFRAVAALDPSVHQLLELYLPLCVGSRAARFVIGHVGQSLDGQIATASGASRNVTGPENIVHLHRLRALCDAVLVGANTVECDDPQLTTRLVSGPNPTRVVIDPRLRSRANRRLYQSTEAPTLILCSARHQSSERRIGQAEVVPVPSSDRWLPPHAIADVLAQRGLKRLFVEGGGISVSRFLQAGALARLHVTICPIFIGRGSVGITLSGIRDLSQALRPRTRRFALGADVLFDCDLGRPE